MVPPSSGRTARPPRSPDQIFQSAVRAHLAGQLPVAIRGYEETLLDQPHHAPAHNNLGTLRAREGNTTRAEHHFRAAVEAQPDYGEAWNNLGILLAGTQRHEEAVDAFIRATDLEPSKAGWHNNLGNALTERFRFHEAIAAFEQATTLDPNGADAWANMAIAWRGLREPERAIAAAERAIAIDPGHVAALNNLGAILKEARRYDEALATFERAIALAPGDATLVANLASVHERRGDFAAMHRAAERARDMDPVNPEPWNLLANYEMEQGRFAEAERHYQHVLGIDRENRNANWNLALIWLMRGDYARGWPQFEWRKRLTSVVTDHGDYGPREWAGESLEGKTILLHTEQGVGDAIQFIRYAPLLHARGARRVLVEAPYTIVPLLQGAHGVDGAVARGTPLPAFDVHASLMSLPALCGTTLDDVPRGIPYLHAEPRAVSSLVDAAPGPVRVGIVWAGNPEHARDHLRSVPLRTMLRLAASGARLYSLQKGAGPEAELRVAEGPVVDLAPHLADFRDTAAAVEQLDLVVAVDTSVAHLAGALGKPTWVLLPTVPDFRWMLGRDDSPWYPSMRLFRQESPGDWDGVMDRVLEALSSFRREGVAQPNTDIVTLSSATRTPDGRPRFDVWFPLAELATPQRFAEYEAELTGAGFDLATRTFLGECLGPSDTYIDADPGLGLTALEVATSPRPPASIHLLGDDALRVAELIARRAPRLPTHCRSAIEAITRPSTGRVFLRLGQHQPEPALLGVADVVVWRGRDVQAFGDGWHHFSLAVDQGESVLDPLGSAGNPDTTVSLRDAVLASLTASDPGDRPASPATRADRVLGIDWALGSDTGWGVYGTNLVLQLTRLPAVRPAVLVEPTLEANPLARARISGSATERILIGPAAYAALREGILLRALGNGFTVAPVTPVARRTVGMVFFEDTALDAAAIARANAHDLVVPGSTWNADVARACGVQRVQAVLQGIDPSIFHPAPRAGLFPGRFVVFSGGKLEFRKGQDIVVGAFREFVRRHPDALLVVAWHNAWPEILCDLDLAGHVHGTPGIHAGELGTVPWLVENGIAPGNVIDLGRQPNALMGQLIREADVALFTNRCEGGTNLVAMECMAAGVPTIVSANTGHLDLVATEGCVPLRDQRVPPHPTRHFAGIEGWGESSVEEVLAVLERAYTDSAWRAEVANRGAAAMARCTWHHQVAQLLEVLAPLW